MSKIILKSFILLFTYNLSFAEDPQNLYDKFTDDIEISGFGDIILSSENTSEYDHFHLGQLELDLESQISEKSTFAFAVAYDGDRFNLGSFELQYKLFQDNDNSNLKSMTFGAGAFDIPFGIDWNFYPSIDRRLISIPLVNTLTHDSWNDMGINLWSEYGNLSSVIYLVNGHKQEFEEPPGLIYEVDAELAFGGRAGFKLADFEIGTSFVINDITNNGDLHLWGFDFQYFSDFLEIQGEYIHHFMNPPNHDKYENYGYYLQTTIKPNKVFGLSRLDIFQFANQSEKTARLCMGVGYIIDPAFQVRVESQINIKQTDNMNMLQIVAGF